VLPVDTIGDVISELRVAGDQRFKSRKRILHSLFAAYLLVDLPGITRRSE